MKARISSSVEGEAVAFVEDDVDGMDECVNILACMRS